MIGQVRRPSPDGAVEFVSALEATSRGIRDPVAKLRFIRRSLSRYQTLDRCVQAIPIPALRTAMYRWLSLEGLRHLLTNNPYGGPIPLSIGTRVSLMLGRMGAAAAVLLLAVGIATGVYQLTRPGTAPVVAAANTSRPAEAPPADLRAPGVAPAAVWLVEKGEGFELYSNGLRIDTTYATTGTPRQYRVFLPTGALREPVETRPVGLLFHTSESDVWPLEANFNESLRGSSQRLLRYVQRNRLYHYVIDRFGRAFRVVDEDSKANHAGHGVWAHGDRVYLNLNHAFLGVSFETRWEGGRALPITQAQFAAGRNLTDYLRQRYEIVPEMCVTHGLTSVNPRKHLIGHHMDWSRGFPFEAFGLPDQYGRPAPSVALFGFGYDDDFLKVLGEPWRGVREAEDALQQEALQRGLAVEEIRRQRQGLYDRWLSEQARDEEARASTGGDNSRNTATGRAGTTSGRADGG
jgi:hypothetical protein